MTAPMGISFRLISYSTHGCEVTVLLAASAFAAGVVIAFTLCRTGTWTNEYFGNYEYVNVRVLWPCSTRTPSGQLLNTFSSQTVPLGWLCPRFSETDTSVLTGPWRVITETESIRLCIILSRRPRVSANFTPCCVAVSEFLRPSLPVALQNVKSPTVCWFWPAWYWPSWSNWVLEPLLVVDVRPPFNVLHIMHAPWRRTAIAVGQARFLSVKAGNRGVASLKFFGGRKKFRGQMFDFRRAIVFCLGHRVSKHKMRKYY